MRRAWARRCARLTAYDPETGQLLSGSFLDYAMPRAEHIPDVISELIEVPARTNPLGIKGIGESGTIGAPPTVVNAVLDALRPSASSTSTCH